MSHYSGVALTGRAGAGKSTIARALLQYRNDWQLDSFAGGLKQDLAKIGVNKGDPGFRVIAQAYGTDFAREKYGPDYWIQRLIDSRPTGLSHLVIDDMRFQNELAVCRSANMYTVYVDTPKEMREHRLGGPVPEHASESGILPAQCHALLRGYDNTPEELAQMIMERAQLTLVQIEARV